MLKITATHTDVEPTGSTGPYHLIGRMVMSLSSTSLSALTQDVISDALGTPPSLHDGEVTLTILSRISVPLCLFMMISTANPSISSAMRQSS